MQETLKEAEIFKENLKYKLKEVERILNDYHSADDHFYSDLKIKVSSNFSRLGNLLREQEESILLRLDELSESKKECLVRIRQELVDRIEKMSFASTEKKESDCLDVDVIDMEESFLKNECDIQVKFNDKIVNFLGDYCTIDAVNPSFSEALEEKCQVPNDDNSNGTQSMDMSKIFESGPTSKGRSISFSCDVEDDDKLPTTFKPSQFATNEEYSVHVCHVKNPGEFYVILTEDLTRRNELERHMNAFTAEVPKEISQGELYMAKYRKRDKFYRVRVVEVLADGDIAMVHNLDYGNMKKVSVSQLSCIPKSLSKDPPMAVKCKINYKLNSSRVNSLQWSVSSMKFMKNIVNCEATMVVFAVQPDHLEIDLKNIRTPNGSREKKLSLFSHIMSLELVRLTTKKDESSEDFSNEAYPTQELPDIGQQIDVIISHVNSSSSFYVQNVSHLDRLKILSKELNEYYAIQRIRGVFYNAKLGTPCASLFSSDGKWYRGKIVGIYKKELRVFYVDYGNEETVEWMSVRKLQEQFLTCLPPVAYCCGLVDLAEEHDEFNNKTKMYLEANIQRNIHRLEILKVNKLNSFLHVFLYGRNKNKATTDDLCLVNLKNKNVTKTKKFRFSKRMHFSEENAFGVSELPEIEIKESLPTDKVTSTPEKKKIQNVPLNVGQVSNEIHTRESCNLVQCKDVDNNIFRPKVEIVSMNSPSSIYVTFPELAGELSKLQSELNEYYKNFQDQEKDKWEVGEKCVAYCSTKKAWCRATVTEWISKDKVKVFLKDFSTYIIVPISSLRLLETSFLNYPVYNFKCHMSDIWPVGKTWPAVTCEFLSNEIETFQDIYITKKGDIESASLPVELWVQKIVRTQKVDEPPFKEWISLNKLLVDQGLALPIMQNLPQTIEKNSAFDLYVKKSSSTLAELISGTSPTNNLKMNTNNAVLDWLPPVPFQRSTFVGTPTYVDAEGVIYLYMKEDEIKLNEIKKELAKFYELEMNFDKRNHWDVGSPCIAKYHFDKCWYRGKIVKVNGNASFDVVFVDYGNIETCEASDLRKNLLNMSNTPILTHKVMLHDVKPPPEFQSWPDSTIDLLHGTVVDKSCDVTVWKHSEDPDCPSLVSLKIQKNGLNVSAFLQHKMVAVLNYEF